MLTAIAPPLAQAHAAGAAPAWLVKVNQVRVASGLAPVTINNSWVAGIQAHLRYLALTPKSYMTGQYASIHTENPQSPYYTSDGATEANKSNLIEGAANGEVNSINTWLSVPFHAIGILRPGLKQVALAVDNKTGMAGLDVISGLDLNAPPSVAPVLFPGNASTTDIPIFGGNEVPDPIETCGGASKYPHPGLPLVALLPSSPDSALTATLDRPSGTVTAPGPDLCVVDENTFVSSDPTYGGTGKQIFGTDHAVFLVPRKPLTAGSYTATIRQPNQPNITWSFTSNPQTMPPALVSQRAVCAWQGHNDGAAIVNVVHLEDYAATGHYTVTLGSTTKTVTAPDRSAKAVTFGGLAPGSYTVKATGTYDAVRSLKVTIPKCTRLLAAWASIGKPDWAHRKVAVTLDNTHNHKGVTYTVLTGQGNTLTESQEYNVAKGRTRRLTEHFTPGHHPIVMVAIGQHVVAVKQFKH
jgi:hypothetical protein